MFTIILLAFISLTQTTIPQYSKDFTKNEQISAELENEIIQVVTDMVSKYEYFGDFWNTNIDQFSNDDYGDFVSLFSGNATIVDDIRWQPDEMNYSAYAKLIFDKMQEVGLRFELQNVEIKKIDIDETGFYIVDLSFTKRLYSGLNKNDRTVTLRSGRAAKLEMRIDLPDYLLSDARIQYIRLHKSTTLLDIAKKPFEFISKKLLNEEK